MTAGRPPRPTKPRAGNTDLGTDPVQADKDPQTLVDPATFDKLALHFAAVQEVTKTYARRAVGQMLLMLKAHADSQHDPDFGRLLPDGRSYRVVPTEPVDAAWHVSLQHTEPYAAACQQIAGGFVHHVPILTEGMADGSSMEYTPPGTQGDRLLHRPRVLGRRGEVLLPAEPGDLKGLPDRCALTGPLYPRPSRQR